MLSGKHKQYTDYYLRQRPMEDRPDHIRKVRLYNPISDNYDSDDMRNVQYRKAPPVPPRCKLSRGGVAMSKPASYKLPTLTQSKQEFKQSASIAGLAAIDDFIEQNKEELVKTTSGETVSSHNSKFDDETNMRHTSGDSGVIPQSSSVHSTISSNCDESKKLKPFKDKLTPVSKSNPGLKGLAALDKLLSSYNILNSSRRASKTSSGSETTKVKLKTKVSLKKDPPLKEIKEKVIQQSSMPDKSISKSPKLTSYKSLNDIDDKELTISATNRRLQQTSTLSSDYSEIDNFYYSSASLPKRGKKGFVNSSYYVSDTESNTTITKQRLRRTLANAKQETKSYKTPNVEENRKLGLTSTDLPNRLRVKKSSTRNILSMQNLNNNYQCYSVNHPALVPRQSKDSAFSNQSHSIHNMIQVSSSHDQHLNLTTSSSSGASYEIEVPLAKPENSNLYVQKTKHHSNLRVNKSDNSIITKARIKKNFIRPLLNFREHPTSELKDLQHQTIPLNLKKDKIKLSRSDEVRRPHHASLNLLDQPKQKEKKKKDYRSENEWENIQNAFPVDPKKPYDRKEEKYFSDANSYYAVAGCNIEANQVTIRKKKLSKVYAPQPGNEKMMSHKGLFNRVFTGFK